jgi:hypothetical protein
MDEEQSLSSFCMSYEQLYLKPSPNLVKEPYELWKGDVAELFIGSDFSNIRRYKEFELSPQGESVDLDVNQALPDHTSGWTWNSGFQVTARIDAKAKIWYGAMRIPFSAIAQRPPIIGRTFRANLFHSQAPPDQKHLIAWQAPMSDTFHVPEKFGLLTLKEQIVMGEYPVPRCFRLLTLQSAAQSPPAFFL